MAQRKKRRKKKKQNRKHLFPVGLLICLALVLVILFSLIALRIPDSPEPRPLSAEDFVWEDGRIRCVTQASIPGIDVSYYQGQVDWQQVQQSGIEFVFIRLGYRSAADGSLHEDEMAQQNLAGATAAGLKVGAYFFSQALTPEEAVTEAHFAMSVLKGRTLDLPLVYDWEEVDNSTRTEGMTEQTLTDCVKAFCRTVEAEGHKSMIYFNRDIADRLLDLSQLTDYPVWFAMYGSPYPDAPCAIDYWQYTDEGTVPGIEGYVDLNLYFPE